MTMLNEDSDRAAFFLAALTLSIPIWQLAYNFGVYGTVFVEHLFAIWAVSIAALMCSFVLSRHSNKAMRISGWSRLLFSLPTFWVISEIIAQQSSHDALLLLNKILIFVVVIFSVPLLIYHVLMIMVPGVQKLRNRRLQRALVGVVMVVALVGFCAGYYHPYLISCADFAIAGDKVPANCWSPNW